MAKAKKQESEPHEAILGEAEVRFGAALRRQGFNFDPTVILVIIQVLMSVLEGCRKNQGIRSPEQIRGICARPGLLRRIQLAVALERRPEITGGAAVADCCLKVGAAATVDEMAAFQAAAREAEKWADTQS